MTNTEDFEIELDSAVVRSPGLVVHVLTQIGSFTPNPTREDLVAQVEVFYLRQGGELVKQPLIWPLDAAVEMGLTTEANIAEALANAAAGTPVNTTNNEETNR